MANLTVVHKRLLIYPGNEREEQTLPPVQDYILLPDYMLAHEYPSEDTLNKEPGWRRFSSFPSEID